MNETKKPIITPEEVRKANSILQKYREGKSSLDARIIDNEEWFRLRHWKNDGRKTNASGWLFNSIANKHADFMDAIPECTVLPREDSDTQTADTLTQVLPVILERCRFEEVYSDATMYKLKTGTAPYAVTWDPDANFGRGEIDIRHVDILNLFWEPGIRRLQDSRNLFYAVMTDNDVLEEQYPQLRGKLGCATFPISDYRRDDALDTSGKSTVVDWYYKKTVGGRQVVHLCKFVNDEVLYASENDPLRCETGFYAHGLYPFVFDALFKEEGAPYGFGYIDIMKDTQESIDILGTEILRNARMASRKRYFSRTDGSINEREFADWSKDFVHVAGSSLGEDSIREITTQPLSGIYLSILQSKIDEIKETSANRDFSQGGTSGGVTSGVAISALQEAGNKMGRDMIQGSYRAFSEICLMMIELIRQFYTAERIFRITSPNGENRYIPFDNSVLLPQAQESEFGLCFGDRLPFFDVKIRSHKRNPFSRITQNSDAMELFRLGFFDPMRTQEALACLELLDFEGKERIRKHFEQPASVSVPVLPEQISRV